MSRSLLIRPLLHARPAAPRLLVAPRRLASSFEQQASPPRLPAEQQAEFERLQRAAEASLSTHTQTQKPSPPLDTSRHVTEPARPEAAAAATSSSSDSPKPTVSAGSLSGGIRKGAAPEFEGDVNPKTREVGGPKNEPLRWGGEGDWSYNGRVTDF